ncbi:MAG: hypothetical protein M3512_17245 [Bacteroidota bacterium]|nr:hypothetical protein [Bacteroidota bacterium]
MNLPKSLLGAILIGITVQTTGCTAEEIPQPEVQNQEVLTEEEGLQLNCPACGMG